MHDALVVSQPILRHEAVSEGDAPAVVEDVQVIAVVPILQLDPIEVVGVGEPLLFSTVAALLHVQRLVDVLKAADDMLLCLGRLLLCWERLCSHSFERQALFKAEWPAHHLVVVLDARADPALFERGVLGLILWVHPRLDHGLCRISRRWRTAQLPHGEGHHEVLALPVPAGVMQVALAARPHLNRRVLDRTSTLQAVVLRLPRRINLHTPFGLLVRRLTEGVVVRAQPLVRRQLHLLQDEELPHRVLAEGPRAGREVLGLAAEHPLQLQALAVHVQGPVVLGVGHAEALAHALHDDALPPGLAAAAQRVERARAHQIRWLLRLQALDAAEHVQGRGHVLLLQRCTRMPHPGALGGRGRLVFPKECLIVLVCVLLEPRGQLQEDLVLPVVGTGLLKKQCHGLGIDSKLATSGIACLAAAHVAVSV
mmetsp:Transcript_124209/g.362539  ORF Transcript_124209/g.362539 Transcript_124209/m.362539 type:complete len:425 (-) Transcript_124209:266-1540(-)